MRLTREENEMLEGKYGYPVQKSMEIMVGLGECYDAEKMIPVASAHFVAGLKMGKAGALLCEEMANKGGAKAELSSDFADAAQDKLDDIFQD